MKDPVQTYVAQPLVDVLQIDPKRSAMSMADAFLLVVLTLSMTRVATIDPIVKPDLYSSQAMHVIGGIILHGWMRFVARNGAVARTGALGVLHVAFRTTFLCCIAIDVREAHMLLTTDLPVATLSLGRSLLQLVEDVLIVTTLYLTLCDQPPPQRDGRQTRTAIA